VALLKLEELNLHGLNLTEAMEKLYKNIDWCLANGVDILVINHGKGHHSERSFSVLKQEVRKYLKNEPRLQDNDYRVIMGESDYPVALSFDAGLTLLVKNNLVNSYIGGQKQQKKNQAVFSDEGKKQRKIAKSLHAAKRKRK